jgi:hypothetical protein
MLTHSSRNYKQDDDIDFIHNYYERLVLQEILQQSSRVQVGDREFMADVACVALNRLPPRYIRHNVDMTFFMSPQDMHEIESKVTNAVAQALNYVESRERGEDIETQSHHPSVTITSIAAEYVTAANVTNSKAENPSDKNESVVTKTKKTVPAKKPLQQKNK